MSLFDLIRKNGEGPKCSAVIVAAGSSVRMGFDKLTAPLGSSPVLLRTLRAFEASENVGEIVIVTRMDRVAEIADLCANNGFTKVSKVVAGGKTRMESSLIGVSAVKTNAKLFHKPPSPSMKTAPSSEGAAVFSGTGAFIALRTEACIACSTLRAFQEARSDCRIPRSRRG